MQLRFTFTDQGRPLGDDEHEVTIKYWRLKENAQSKLNNWVRRGKLRPLPCEICGNPKVHGHHKDYREPLSITWLCHKHHQEQMKGKSRNYRFLGGESYDPTPPPPKYRLHRAAGFSHRQERLKRALMRLEYDMTISSTGASGKVQ